ncbi:hypothetical protein FHW69_001136 [Luteibacter sp. Sphag1AF]|nr:hypothetical protein [Luteibacter sp. Sphag1AF]
MLDTIRLLEAIGSDASPCRASAINMFVQHGAQVTF